MKRKISFLIVLFSFSSLFAQVADVLQLDDCFRLAEEKYTGNKQITPLSSASLNRLKNYNTHWLPSVSLSGQVTYQSEIVQLKTFNPIEGRLVSIDLPLDQYKFQAEITQLIYDGGVTRIQKDIEKNTLNMNIQQVQIDLHSFKQIISQVFFSIILTEKNHEILSLGLTQLKEKENLIRSGVSHGVLTPDNLSVIEAEELSIEQKLTDVLNVRLALINQLSILLDTTFTSEVKLDISELLTTEEKKTERPEYKLFELQKQQLSFNQKLLTAADLPKLSAFAQLGYGRPGFDFLNDNFHEYYLVGAGFKWNFIRYGETKRERKILELNKEIIDIRKEMFDKNIQVSLGNELQNINKYKEMIEKDKKIIELRKSVADASFAKLKNGVITSADYISDMNAELQAKLQLENHQIMLMQSITNYLLIKGGL
jgi:outer membrane protein TolC